MARHTLEQRTVAALLNGNGRQRGMARTNYLRQMQAWGYTLRQALDCFRDVQDVAELERSAK